MADITYIEARHTSTAGTLLVLAAGVTLFAVVVSVAQRGSGGRTPPPPPRTPESLSCPLVYAWDGSGWRLESGTFGGAVAPALARTELDVLDHVVTEDGFLRLKVANQLPETDHVDAIAVLAVDHDPDVAIAVGQDGRVHTVERLHAPFAAVDADGRDVLARVGARDDWGWESALRIRDTGTPRDLRDGIVLSFPREPGVTTARLVIDARATAWAAFMMTEYLEAHGHALDQWFTALAADPARAAAFRERMARDAFLRVSVLTAGGWQVRGLAWDAPPELVRRQAVPLDLTGVHGDSVRVRLDAPPSFWLIDHVAITYGADRDIAVQRLPPEPVRPADEFAVTLLAHADGRHLVLERGDEIELRFRPPGVTPGRARTYLVEATGWYRIHTSGTGSPQRALLERLDTEPDAIARLAIERMNDALAGLAADPASRSRSVPAPQ